MDKENKLILYRDEEGRMSMNTRFAEEDVWLTQDQLAEIYQTTQENISMHISNIYADGELEKEGTYKKFLLVRQEGKELLQKLSEIEWDDFECKAAQDKLPEDVWGKIFVITFPSDDNKDFNAHEE